MNLFKFAFVFLAAALFLTACSGTNSNTAPTTVANSATNQPAATTPTAPPDELATTREIYAQQCANCHQENGEGGPKTIDGEKIKVPNFKDPRVSREPDDDYLKQIKKGGDGMPAYQGKISDEEIKNLVRLIRRDFQGKN